ncbi:MAG: hypothetical protein CL797_03285 [Chromatiales bacterium]|jgi:diguanylate cyclase (GGDEF)-like protein|nr:hypothetical protein [Chromatiales bacterium]
MTIEVATFLPSPVAEQRRVGFRGLRFSEPLEDDFRKYYSQSSARRARVMPSFTIMMTLVMILLRLSNNNPNILALIFNCFILLPLVISTLYVSTLPNRYKLFQILLALTGLLSGFVIVSLVFNPTLPNMPSFMSIEVAWIFSIWLILGLRFRVAALTALTVTAAHIAGFGFIDPSAQRAGYEVVMLIMVNGIGAMACYHLEYAMRQLFLESAEVNELATELTKLAQLDGLTGLHNRRSYDQQIMLIWHQSRREKVLLALALIDIDHFKPYNDHYGHQKGDDALISVARVIASSERRPLDFAARYGGEEFILALYGQDGAMGHKIAESLRKSIQELKIPHGSSPTGQYLTVSIGVAAIQPDTDRSIAGALQMADEALYQTKDEGRNRVITRESHTAQLSTGKFRADGTDPA